MEMKKFQEYLINSGLFGLKIWEDETGMHAIVNSMPDLEWFSQFEKVPKLDGLFQVRLGKKDYYNEEITKGFFNK